MLRRLALLFTTPVLLAGCVSRATVTGATANFWEGDFDDDYGGRHTVSREKWVQHPRSIYHIVAWNPSGQYLIARNDSTNPSAAGLWTRIDFVRLDGMAPWAHAFCFSAYKAPTRAAAESTHVANPLTPRTGCNGFPYSRLKRR